MELIVILTTVASLEEAHKIANTLVVQSLVACANISRIESIYSWKGEVQNDQEFRIMLKTTKAQYPAVESVIRELHSYELPAIYAMAIEHAYEPYAAWVRQCVTGGENIATDSA